MASFKPTPKTMSKAATPAPANSGSNAKSTSTLEITDVSVRPFPNPSGKSIGFASVVLGNAVALRDLKIVEGSKGLFVAFPQRAYEGPEGKEYVDIYCPISKEMRDDIQDAVLSTWNEQIGGGHDSEPTPPPAPTKKGYAARSKGY